MTKLQKLKKHRAFIEAKIAKLEGNSLDHMREEVKPQPCPPREYKLKVTSPNFVIEFDGGTSSNMPPHFGRGYGSFLIQCMVNVDLKPKVHRVEFGQGHSCNSAEIRTLVCALAELAQMIPAPDMAVVLVRGDSKIALKWVTCRQEPKMTTSQGFREAIALLWAEVAKFKRIKVQWRGRAKSVELFGH